MRKQTKEKTEVEQKAGRIHRLRHHPFVLPVIAFMLMFFVSLALFVSFNGKTIGASDSRVVRITVDGKERVIPTRSATVGELLNKLDIKLNESDLVEPSAETQILEENLKVEVLRARPVTVIDGDKKYTLLTAQKSPQDIVEKVGVQIYPEDGVKSVQVQDILSDGSVGDRYVVDRATPVFINLYGNSITARTRVKTVADVLKEKDIKTVPGDTIQPSLDTPIGANTQIFISRFGKKIVTEEVAIEAPVQTIEDGTLVFGSTQVKDPGAPGKKLVTYEIETKNDKEVSRKSIQEVVASEPKKKVVLKGTKVVISNPSANVELGRQIAEEMGVGSQFGCLYQLFDRESHWNHLAANRSSGAYGIPQALPGSKMGPGWQYDPAVQIRWGINYTKKYGGPCGAWNFWQVNHWY